MLNHINAHPLLPICHFQTKFEPKLWKFAFIPSCGTGEGTGSSAIYSCKFNVSESDGTLWLHVFASHLRASSTLRSGAHSVKWDQQCENIKDESHSSNKKPPVKKGKKKENISACLLISTPGQEK